MFDDWISWTNGFYLMGLVLAGIGTMIAAKYTNVIKEMREVAKALEDGYADGKLTKAEKDKVMKEALDVMKSVINLKWKIF
ncbi:hypothetical protein CMI38_06560 [Candidatus Pacearchaeota archaeon]|nr:hypothetical protein [Candidatus Pacearchaeota archaeon]|tara:strand:- start:380 stop:622 length:243 start_codon:yes stop_codon:yes gene_type:complete